MTKLTFTPASSKVAKRVTLPFIKQRSGLPIHVYFLAPYAEGKRVRDEDKEPAQIGHVINLESSEESEMILSKVTRSLLDEHYPNDGYVGKAFRIELMSVEGKKYHKVLMDEIELSTEDQKILDEIRIGMFGK